MSLDQARQFADQAAHCLQGGQPGLALDLADQALMLSPGMGDAENLRGVALSQSGQPRAAEEAFLRAAKSMPTSAKPLYNLGVHFYGLGRKQEALEREPGHSQAFALQTLIQDGSPKLNPEPRSSPVFLALEDDSYGNDYRYEWLRESQSGWKAIGWILAATNMVAVSIVATSKPAAFENSVPWYLFWLFLGSYILGVAYIGVDTAARSRSKFWFAIVAVSGCFLGWAVLPIYLLTSKKWKRGQAV